MAPAPTARAIGTIVPEDDRAGYDVHDLVDALVDDGTFFELKPLYAKEIVTGFARLAGRSVGILANNPDHLGGVLFVDSADKAARFIWLCDAFNVPLVFLADVPGFMIGTQVERQGIIRHGAKMITAVTEATVPKVSVIVRKAYGAGLYAMCGTGFRPRRLPGAADRPHRGDGSRGGGERRVLQPDPGDRGPRRAGGLRRGAAPPLRGGHRPGAPRLGARHRRRRRRPRTCAASSWPGFAAADGKARERFERRHGVPPV